MLSFLPPPASVLPNPLPSLPPSNATWPDNAQYALSTHIVPASYLRSTPLLTNLPSCPPDTGTLSRQERNTIALDGASRLRELRCEQDRAPQHSEGYPRVLWICLNRYARRNTGSSKKTGLTLFCAHANGFGKEIWEPMLHRLFASNSSIDEVWTWETINHGDSGLLNAHSLNALHDWRDACRDLISFLGCFIPNETSDASLPLHLTQVPSEETTRRLSLGFSNRKIILVGHSFGGCVGVLAAHQYPSLFDAIILLDPVILRPFRDPKDIHSDVDLHVNLPRHILAIGAIARRNAFNSKQHALEVFSSSPFFRTWDKEVLKNYVEHGVHQTSDGKYKLKTDPLQEAITFAETITGCCAAWLAVPHLDERIELRWLMPGPGFDELVPGDNRHKVWLRPANSSHTQIAGAGHLIPHMAPKTLAREIATFIQRRYGIKANL